MSIIHHFGAMAAISAAMHTLYNDSTPCGFGNTPKSYGMYLQNHKKKGKK